MLLNCAKFISYVYNVYKFCFVALILVSFIYIVYVISWVLKLY